MKTPTKSVVDTSSKNPNALEYLDRMYESYNRKVKRDKKKCESKRNKQSYFYTLILN